MAEDRYDPKKELGRRVEKLMRQGHSRKEAVRIAKKELEVE
jgi:hypothetical protein